MVRAGKVNYVYPFNDLMLTLDGAANMASANG